MPLRRKLRQNTWARSRFASPFTTKGSVPSKSNAAFVRIIDKTLDPMNFASRLLLACFLLIDFNQKYIAKIAFLKCFGQMLTDDVLLPILWHSEKMRRGFQSFWL